MNKHGKGDMLDNHDDESGDLAGDDDTASSPETEVGKAENTSEDLPGEDDTESSQESEVSETATDELFNESSGESSNASEMDTEDTSGTSNKERSVWDSHAR